MLNELDNRVADSIKRISDKLMTVPENILPDTRDMKDRAMDTVRNRFSDNKIIHNTEIGVYANEKLDQVEVPDLSVPDLKGDLSIEQHKEIDISEARTVLEKVKEVKDVSIDSTMNVDSLANKLTALILNRHGIVPDVPKESPYDFLAQYQPSLQNKTQDKEFVYAKLAESASKLTPEAYNQSVRRIKEAGEQLARLKAKYNELKSMDDLEKSGHDPFRGSKFSENLGFGGEFFITPKSPFKGKIAPLVSLKLYERFVFGTGLSYMITVNRMGEHFHKDQELFGFQSFLDFKVIKGIFLTTVYEKQVENLFTEKYLDWTDHLFAGVKKKINVSDRLTGNVQVLYNIMYDPETSPYPKRWTIRFGFDIIRKKNKNLER